MKLSGRNRVNLKGIPNQDHDGMQDDSSKSSASNLRILLEKRKLLASKLQGEVKSNDDMNMLSVEDVANLLHESDVLTKCLEEQIVFYQDSLAGLRLRTEQVVSENEMLYERLKETPTFADAPEGNRSTVKFGEKEDRKYLYQLENELDEVKRLNQDKTCRLESIIESTRKELDTYREQVSRLQSQLRAMNNGNESAQKSDNVCFKCGGLSYFSSQPSMAQMTTLDKLSKERDELAEMLAKHKSLLEQCQQREFEAYMEVKKSAETAESANLEKAEAIIKIKQLENSFEEERKRHEALVSSTNEKWKRECDDAKEKFQNEKQTFQAKIHDLTKKCDEGDHQLDKLTREKVNFLADLEKSKAELAAFRIDFDKVEHDSKNKVIAITRERVKVQQELDDMKNAQARQFKEHEQVKISLTIENEGLKRRLVEAQSSWLETREENLKAEEKLKQLENELYLLTLSKTNLETVHEQNREFYKKQEEQKEQQFVETLQKTESNHAELRKELEEMLQAQMKMSSAMKDENKRLLFKLEEKKANHRSEKTKWREQLDELTSELDMARKQNRETTTDKDNLSQINDELAGKVKFLKRENKKSLKMIYNLLKKQKDLMQDRQILSHELESLQRSQMAGTPLQRYASQEAGNISTNEQGSGVDTSCKVTQSNVVELNNEDESL